MKKQVSAWWFVGVAVIGAIIGQPLVIEFGVVFAILSLVFNKKKPKAGTDQPESHES